MVEAGNNSAFERWEKRMQWKEDAGPEKIQIIRFFIWGMTVKTISAGEWWRREWTEKSFS